MHLVVDGIVFERQHQRGISRIYSEALPQVCNAEEELNVELITLGTPKQLLPTHPRIQHLKLSSLVRLVPDRWFRQPRRYLRAGIQSFHITNRSDAIWHSTYFTRPLRWQGHTVVTLPDMIYELFPNIFSRKVDEEFREHRKRCLQEADAIICISESTQKDLFKHFPTLKARTYVIPLACSDTFRKLDNNFVASKRHSQKPFLLYVGSRYRHKNFIRLLVAYQGWTHQDAFDLVVVGPPWSETELNWLHKLNIYDHLFLTSSASDEELCLLYNQAAAFIYPSVYEGFGLPLLEAMQCGCPIVASKIPSSLEVAEDCAVYFEPESIDGLRAAMTVAVSEGRDAKRVVQGLIHSRAFSWDQTARLMADVYNSFC